MIFVTTRYFNYILCKQESAKLCAVVWDLDVLWIYTIPQKWFFPTSFVLFLIILTVLSCALDLFGFWPVLSTHLSFPQNYPLWLPELLPWMLGIKLEITFCVFTSCYFPVACCSAFLNTEFQPTQSCSNMKPFPKVAAIFMCDNPNSCALFANFLFKFFYSCAIKLGIMPKHSLKSKLVYPTHCLHSPAWSLAETCTLL